MKAVVIASPGELELREIAKPEHSSEALIRVLIAGVCGTDSKIVKGSIPVEPPLVLGHEIIGVVEEPGGAGLVEKGSRVLVNPSISCGRCRLCRGGRSQLCEQGGRMGMDSPGGFTEYLAIPEDRLHIIPESIPDFDAVLVQVLGTCVHAQDLVEIRPDQLAVVIGLGVPGFMHLQMLAARGARVAAVTRSRSKLELASAMGAAGTATPEEARELVSSMSDGNGADLVVESVGNTETFRLAIELAAIGGALLVYGVLTGSSADLPLPELYRKELKIFNSRGATGNDYDTAVRLVESKRISVSSLLSTVYPLDEAIEVLMRDELDPHGLKVAFSVGPLSHGLA